MTEPKLTCVGCGRCVYEDPSHYMHFCTYCLSGAAYFSVAVDFSRFPAGVTKDDGEHSGEHLREVLQHRLYRSPLVVNMDGTQGYGSSFLAAAFSALGTSSAISPEAVEIRSEDKSIIKEVEGYLRADRNPYERRMLDRQIRERRIQRLKDDLYKACMVWDPRLGREPLADHVLEILPEKPEAPWMLATHKTRGGQWHLRKTRRGFDVREQGSDEHESGVDPSYVRAEFVFVTEIP